MIPRIISDQFRQECNDDFGIRPAHAIAAIEAPDHVELVEDDGLKLVLCLKRITATTPQHWLLILEHVMEKQSIVLYGLRAYDDILADLEITPLRVLERIVENFGIPIQVGTRTAKFILEETIPITSADEVRLVTVPTGATVSFSHQLFFKIQPGPPRVARCALCFRLNIDEYKAYLLKARAR